CTTSLRPQGDTAPAYRHGLSRACTKKLTSIWCLARPRRRVRPIGSKASLAAFIRSPALHFRAYTSGDSQWRELPAGAGLARRVLSVSRCRTLVLDGMVKAATVRLGARRRTHCAGLAIESTSHQDSVATILRSRKGRDDF